MIKIFYYIGSCIVNIVYFIILRMELYTDRYRLPDDEFRERTYSALEKLSHADKSYLSYIEIILMVVSVVTSILVLCGVKNNIVKIIQIGSTIASTVIFIIILFVAGNIHLKY